LDVDSRPPARGEGRGVEGADAPTVVVRAAGDEKTKKSCECDGTSSGVCPQKAQRHRATDTETQKEKTERQSGRAAERQTQKDGDQRQRQI